MMSAPDKVELLGESARSGFRNYLYYVATEDPEINVERVRMRVMQGGHDVPADEIVQRYERSLGLLAEAVSRTNRAYFFDSSGSEPSFFAEITSGTDVEFKTQDIPNWFQTHVLDKFAIDHG